MLAIGVTIAIFGVLGGSVLTNMASAAISSTERDLYYWLVFACAIIVALLEYIVASQEGAKRKEEGLKSKIKMNLAQADAQIEKVSRDLQKSEQNRRELSKSFRRQLLISDRLRDDNRRQYERFIALLHHPKDYQNQFLSNLFASELAQSQNGVNDHE